MPSVDCAAAARLRTAPPIPTRRGPDDESQSSEDSVARTCDRRRASSFFLAGPEPGRNCSVIRTAPSPNDAILPACRSRTSISCMLPPPRSSTTPSVSVVVLIAAT